MSVVLDFETRSYADLKKVGAWAYSEHETTEVICLCYQIGDDPIREWWPGHPDGDKMPEDLYTAVMTGHEVEAHNCPFELSIWQNVMVARFKWAPILLHQWRDTMAVARYYALPAALDRLCSVLGFGGKDPEGGRLIQRYSKLHLKTAKVEIPDEDFNKFVDYCRRDVELERKVSDHLGPLPDDELEIFKAELEMGYRGLALDAAGIEAATAIVEAEAERMTARFRELTSPNGNPDLGLNPTQRDKVLGWFQTQGLNIQDLQAETLEEVLEEAGLPQCDLREAVVIKLALNKASTKKLDAMARQVGKDGRARFQFHYHGAQTGRPTGTGFQPLNLSRGFEAPSGQENEYAEMLARNIMYRDPRWLEACYGDATEAVAKAARHWIVAGSGNRIISGDFSSIEAVILAALAGEDWKLDIFRRREPVYERTAERIYKLPPGAVTKKDPRRQTGKIAELACGYGGGLNAWLNFDSSGTHSDEQIRGYVRDWRDAHPMVKLFWRGLEVAAIEAVHRPSVVARYRDIAFRVYPERQSLAMILPDGKHIWYRDPQIRAVMPKWHDPLTDEECAEGTCGHEPMPALCYKAWKFGAWRTIYTYGGKLTENAVQATARQRLAPAMIRAERAGYTCVLSVYDELVAEVPKSHGSVAEFEEIMSEPAGDWDRDWPIRVEAWEGARYRK